MKKLNTNSIPEIIQSSVYRNRRGQALWLISKLVNDITTGLYAEYYKVYIRLVNMYRIRLLVDWNMYRYALAYVSLETELNPDDHNASVYKEFLKTRIINFMGGGGQPPILGTLKSKWEGVAGMRDMKTIFERDVIFPFTERNLYERYKVPLPNGILLYGPPGCGKTFIAKKLSEQVNFDFIDLSVKKLAMKKAL